MLELLVTLVLIGLLSALVAPAISGWLESRSFASQKSALTSTLAAMPAKAAISNATIVISQPLDLGLENVIDSENVNIYVPVKVLSNGYCLGGEIGMVNDGSVFVYEVLPPFCQLRAKSNQ